MGSVFCFRFSALSVFTIALVAVVSCVEEEPVELYAQPHSKRLVIDGMITSEFKPHRVSLTFSAGYDKAP